MTITSNFRSFSMQIRSSFLFLEIISLPLRNFDTLIFGESGVTVIGAGNTDCVLLIFSVLGWSGVGDK